VRCQEKFQNKVKNGKIVAEGNFRCNLTNKNTVYQKYKIGNAF
jgi:predicted flavoprotein YhiN